MRDGARPRRPYLAKLAHELKTPLTAIVSAAEVMRDERLGPLGDARYKDYSSDIYRTASHALDVINRMMDVRRLDLIKSPSDPRHVTEIDVAELLANIASSMSTLSERAGLKLVLKRTPELPRLIADELHIRQVLFNLITNAIKFTPAGGRITVQAVFAERQRLQILIDDTGPGIAQDVIAEVMGRDTGVDVTQPPAAVTDFGADQSHLPGERNEGLGFGLPLVRKLVGENGGSLDILTGHDGRSGTRIAVSFGSDRLVFA
ncbi:MAG: HAMP domain-containing sensor histidine kinase [Pseudomonadota bacterium]